MCKRPPERRVIRLFPDYGRDWPLWESSTSTWDVGYTTNPEMYGLSEHLAQDMARWTAFWERHFDPFEGWDHHENRERWRRDGERIASRLRHEVTSFADVQYEPWPLEDETPASARKRSGTALDDGRVVYSGENPKYLNHLCSY